MTVGLISYVISISFCLFLIVQSLIYYFFLSGNSELKQSRNDLPFIILIAISVFTCLIMGVFSYLYPGMAALFDKLEVISGIVALFFYVMLLRFISVAIKDMTFVETDGYKKKNRIYLILFFILCLLSILSVVIFYFNKNISGYYIGFQFFFILILIIIGIIEQTEFNKILKKEIGKMSTMHSLRYKTMLWTGGAVLITGIAEMFLYIMNMREFYVIYGSPMAYGVCIMMIGLSLNFVYEYMDAMKRANETNKKLTELNRQMMDDVRTAQSLQISLLPLDKQKFIQNFIDMEISYMPMQSVGGDYYDFYKLDENNLLIFLGDASGHGVYAAMIWAILKVEVEELIENKYFNNLAQAFTLLNQRITRILENTYSYATLFACSINLESRTINFISAGHTDQLYFSKVDKVVKRVRNKNPIIGTFKNAKFTADSITCKSGDVLLLFSDGIVEGINPDGKQLGKERLEKIFLEVAKQGGSASDMISALLLHLEDFFEGTLQKDDRTIMIIKL